MKLLNLDHVGIAVTDLDQAVESYRLRYEVEPLYRRIDESLGAEEAMIPVGGSYVQLLSPVRAETPLGEYVSNNGEGLHHIAFAVASIDAALEHLRTVDARLIDGIGSSGPGPRTLFVDPTGFGGTLVELVVLNDA